MSSSPRLGRKSTSVRFAIFAIAAIASLIVLQLNFFSAKAVSTTVVISEFRVRGPNGAADEFIELYNVTNDAINIGGWKINGSNASAGTGTRVTIPTGTMIPGRGHFLITNSSASGGPYSGPVSGNLNYTTGVTDDGGIALLNSSNVIIDQVGMSNGSAYKEGTVLASLGSSNTNQCYERKPGGANGSTQDTDVNSADFQLIAPCAPQNLASSPTPGGTPTSNPGALQFSSSTYSIAENGGNATITVNRTGGSDGSVSVNYATSNGTATGSDYNSAAGTLNFAQGETSKTFTVAILDDAEYEGDETVALALTTATGGATVGSPSAATLTITENENPPVVVTPGSVVISQIYGGGGNSGAVYNTDFIEIFNRSSDPVSLNGWSVQYSSATGSSWSNRTNLSGTIAPGQYYLISGSSGANGSALPAADKVGDINMSGSTGKVALVNSTTALTGTCPTGPHVIDFVGYGTSANCSEGPGPAPQLGNATAALRARNGCKDTDYNAVNFTEVTPSPRNSSSPLNVCPAGDEAPEVFNTKPTSGEFNVTLNSNITINFDQMVNVAGGWFQISCGTSGTHTATVLEGGSAGASFTLDPDTDFAGSEQCTVTIFASAVTDQDAQDPPDNMAANYVFSFNTFVPRDPAEHMVMGNPSAATTDTSVPDNYLMMKDQYALSYNNSKGIANWTSWHLDTSWTTGVSDRQNDFRPDETLPAGFLRVASGYNFATYGFDRGHMVPSADRTSSETDNSATFLMTNMIPQASGNNQGPWADMENYLRTLLNNGNSELYILSGGQGVGGTSSKGNFDSITDTAGQSVTVPKWTWKVIMVLPTGDNDVARVSSSTRTFAVIMPNNQNIEDDDWKKYLATVDQVEALTGYNFFSNVPEDIQNVIEAKLDSEYNTAPVANGQSAATAEDTPKQLQLTASDFNVNNVLSYSIVDGPQNGSLSDIVDGKLTYTPNGDYNGSDSFTFKVNDGGKDSNVATVTLNVTAVNDAPVLTNVPESATIDELVSYTFTASASDVDGPTLSFSLVGQPAGASIDAASGVFSWTPTEAQGGAGTVYSFTVRVTDGTATADAAVSLSVNEVNQNPTLQAIGSKTVTLGNTLTFKAAGADADVPFQTLKYSLSGAPAGATINEDTGDFSWTPTASQVGAVYTFSVIVRDSMGGQAEQSVPVGVGYSWSGLLPPVVDGGSYKLGRTLPLKFQLTGASAGLSNAVARLSVFKIGEGGSSTPMDVESTSAATTGNLFRYDETASQYIFNWSTAGYTTGTYQLQVDLGDGVLRTTTISLK